MKSVPRFDQLKLQLEQQEIAARGEQLCFFGRQRRQERWTLQKHGSMQRLRRQPRAQEAYDGYAGESEEERQALSEALQTALSERGCGGSGCGRSPECI